MTQPTVTTPISRLASLHAVGVMCTPIVHCPPDTRLAEVARLMAHHSIHCVATGGLSRDRVTGLRRVWGIVTDTDVVGAALAGDDAIPVAEFAGGEIVTVDPDDTLDIVARLMREHEVSHVIVVADDEPVGVISTLDVAAAVARTP